MGPPHKTWIKNSVLAEENVSIFTGVQLLCQESCIVITCLPGLGLFLFSKYLLSEYDKIKVFCLLSSLLYAIDEAIIY